MNNLTRLNALLAALAIGAVTVVGAGCGDDNKKNDDLGDQIEKSADDAGDSIDNAADDVGNAVDETSDDAADALDGKDNGKKQSNKP